MFSIGRLAKAAGVTTPTVRLYEQIGLLPQPSRSASGRRTYGSEDLERLVFIRRCRDFGFPIEQVRQLAGLAISPDQDCGEVGDTARAHLRVIRGKLAELQALERSLRDFAARCDDACRGGPGKDCAVFRDLGAVSE